MTYDQVGVLFHPRQPAARVVAEELCSTVLASRQPWIAATGDYATLEHHIAGTELIICVGGDGTMLWAARMAVRVHAAIVGINMGHLGFLSELTPQHAAEGLATFLEGGGRVDERTMVQCHTPHDLATAANPPLALNDIVIGRPAPGRPVYLSIAIDGRHVARVRADALIIATATGSTAYNLSAGGPVLQPHMRELVLTPVAPHLSRLGPIIVDAAAQIDVDIESENGAVVSVDGQIEAELQSQDRVLCRRSPYVAKFLRLGPPSDFFSRLADHLNLSTRSDTPPA